MAAHPRDAQALARLDAARKRVGDGPYLPSTLRWWDVDTSAMRLVRQAVAREEGEADSGWVGGAAREVLLRSLLGPRTPGGT